MLKKECWYSYTKLYYTIRMDSEPKSRKRKRIDLSPCAQWRNTLLQKAELEAPRSTTQAASPLGFMVTFKSYFNTENRKAFAVGLFQT